MADDNLDEQEIQVGNSKLGGNTLVKLNIKTIAWIFGILYTVLGYLYFDLRQELKESVTISTEEKAEFFRDVEKDFDSKLDKIQEITTSIRLDQALMKGDIKLILDREQRVHADEGEADADVEVSTTLPPQ